MVDRARLNRLSPELEKSLLAGVIWGAVAPEVVDPKELSPHGHTVLKAVKDLLIGGCAPPLPLHALWLT